MIGPISPSTHSSGFDFAAYAASRARSAAPRQASAAAHQAAAPQTPVRPVASLGKTTADTPSTAQSLGLSLREGADPAEMAVRMRIQYVGDTAQTEAKGALRGPLGADRTENGMKLPGTHSEEDDGVKNAQEVMEEGECQTCAERKYQDGSNDPGVSFKSAAHIDPDQSAATVRGHEMEHVVRNQAKAEREGREIVSQTVTISNAICPECGKVYTSGGTTRTVYSGAEQPQEPDPVRPAGGSFSAVA